jgi:hypothetical protein
VLASVVGTTLAVEIVVVRDWLAEHAPPAADETTPGRAIGA